MFPILTKPHVPSINIPNYILASNPPPRFHERRDKRKVKHPNYFSRILLIGEGAGKKRFDSGCDGGKRLETEANRGQDGVQIKRLKREDWDTHEKRDYLIQRPR